ncbi:urokinase plasminogen activator surface receptor-like [Melanotaenia boesemani]|uniref:urokinase plasminogen activator surface receptor-like n=1 Tax=Melanotaenia boesemani TaxID=1250792 RepID=UPI001C05321E|nr:urokinase plasminogen activator surface receptor-like [Melanotaenia boesemani]
MMKLIIFLTLLCMFSSSAGALVCQSCANLQCSSTITKTCSSETMCITASIQATSSGTTGQQIYKDCASSSLCPIPGNQTFSVNVGFAGARASVQCCNTDNCNSQTLPFPGTQTTNSLQCAVCNPSTSQCTSTVQCSGEESNCFQATVTNGSSAYPALGCMTPNTCAAAASLGTLPFMAPRRAAPSAVDRAVVAPAYVTVPQ